MTFGLTEYLYQSECSDPIGRRRMLHEDGRDNIVDNGIFIHATHPRHVETVCCLYHQKKDFISVPYEPKNTDYLKKDESDEQIEFCGEE